MKHLRYLAILSLVGGSLGSAFAEDQGYPPVPMMEMAAIEPDDIPADADRDSNPALDPERVSQLATTYGVSEQQVRTMRQTDNMGWGDIDNLLLISQRLAANSANTETPLTSEQALAEVLRQRQSGMGIGEIANSHNVTLGDLRSGDNPNKLDNVESGDRPDKPEKLDRPDKPEKLDRPGKPEKLDRPDKPEKPNRPNQGY